MLLCACCRNPLQSSWGSFKAGHFSKPQVDSASGTSSARRRNVSPRDPSPRASQEEILGVGSDRRRRQVALPWVCADLCRREKRSMLIATVWFSNKFNFAGSARTRPNNRFKAGGHGGNRPGRWAAWLRRKIYGNPAGLVSYSLSFKFTGV